MGNMSASSTLQGSILYQHPNVNVFKIRASLAEQKKREEDLTNEIQNAKLRISEVSEKLNEVAGELQNAGIAHHEGHRQQRKAEILESFKRLYPDSVVSVITNK